MFRPALWGIRDKQRHINSGVLCYNRNKSSIQYLATTECKNMENIFVNFIWINAHDKSAVKIILYQFKRDICLRKRPKCPWDMPRTWRRTAATPRMGLRVFVGGLWRCINHGVSWPRTLFSMAPRFQLLYWCVNIGQGFYAESSKTTNLNSVAKVVLDGYARVRLYVRESFVRWVHIKRYIIDDILKFIYLKEKNTM